MYLTCANLYRFASSSSTSSSLVSFLYYYKWLCMISYLLLSLIVCCMFSAIFLEFNTFKPCKNCFVSTYVLTPLNIFSFSLNNYSLLLCMSLSLFCIAYAIEFYLLRGWFSFGVLIV